MLFVSVPGEGAEEAAGSHHEGTGEWATISGHFYSKHSVSFLRLCCSGFVIHQRHDICAYVCVDSTWWPRSFSLPLVEL